MKIMEKVTFKWLNIFIITLSLNVTEQAEIACTVVQENQREEAFNDYIRCQGTLLESLHGILANISNPIETFELYNSTLDILPEDIFRDVSNPSVRKVIFSESCINLVSLPESNVHPFYSIENTLENFEIYDSSFAFAWNFSLLSNLNALQSIIIENSDVLAIEDQFESFPNIRFIQMINCKIRWIHKEAFKQNMNLTICSLSNNFIEIVQRSMFPRPALYLWSLDLSFNRLEYLPKDLFTDMTNLKELKLDFNRLNTQGSVYKTVWNHLTQLWLDGNDMICWTLCSVLSENKREENDRPEFFNSSQCKLRSRKKVLLDSFDC